MNLFLAIVGLFIVVAFLINIYLLFKIKNFLSQVKNRYPQALSGMGDSWIFVLGYPNWIVLLNFLLSKEFKSIPDEEIQRQGKILKSILLIPIIVFIAAIVGAFLLAFISLPR